MPHPAIALALAAALAAAGCAATETVPYHPAKSPDQVRQDRAECDLRAAEATAAIRGGLEAGFRRAELREQCMSARGYRDVPVRR